MHDHAERQHSRHVEPVPRPDHEQRGEDRGKHRPEKRDDGDEPGEGAEGQPVGDAEEEQAKGCEDSQHEHGEQLAADPGAEGGASIFQYPQGYRAVFRGDKRHDAVAVQRGVPGQVQRHHDDGRAFDEQFAAGAQIRDERAAQEVGRVIDEPGHEPRLRVGELGAPHHRILAGPIGQDGLDVGEGLGQAGDERLGLVEDRGHDQGTQSGDEDDRAGRGDREPEPARQPQAALEEIREGGEVHGEQDGEEDEEQHLDHPDREPDGQGCNEERHERGARQPRRRRGRLSVQGACPLSSSSTSWASVAPLPSCLVSGGAPAPSRPSFFFRSSSCWSASALPSRLWNCFISWSPERSSLTSAAAMSLRSSCSICSAMRSNVSKALLSPIEDIVSWMRLWASARFWRAIRMFFLRLASSILSFSCRRETFSFSVSSRCLTHVSCSVSAPWACSLWRSSACLARSSRPSCTARTARFSQSSAAFFSWSTCAARRFSSAMADATCCLALASWVRMSTISWFNIFSGFSAREIRSLMFDRTSVERRSKIPMVPLEVVADLHGPAPSLRCRRSASTRSAKSNRSASSETCPWSCAICSSSACRRGASAAPTSPVPSPQRRRRRARIPSAIASPMGEGNNQRNTSAPASRGARPPIRGTT